MIPVTKPFLPPIDDYTKMVRKIWERQWLTNNGPLVNELELKLKEYLRVPHLLYMTNGTIAIQIAIKSLQLTGTIITTPFSYVATTSSIVWENCSPIFVDIDPQTLNMDPTKIEAVIKKDTTAILATHVYGNPCDIDAIESVAKKFNLKVIYDAAHCFGTKYKGRSVFEFGDISTTSFHATKLFHTTEGGAVFTADPECLKVMAYMRNFGHDGPEAFHGVGINGKNSEFHAAMGLVNLQHVEAILHSRQSQSAIYDAMLVGKLSAYKPISDTKADINYAYYPIVFETEMQLLKALEMLNGQYIYPRRYFYPSLNNLSYVGEQPCPISEDIAKRVMCLPMYFDLKEEDIHMICRILLRAQNY